MLAGTTDTHPGDSPSTSSELSGREGETEITWVFAVAPPFLILSWVMIRLGISRELSPTVTGI